MYHLSNIVRVIKSRRLSWANHIARMEESRSVFKILAVKTTRKRPLRRPRSREIGINRRNWVVSAQDRDYWRDLVNATMNLRIP